MNTVKEERRDLVIFTNGNFFSKLILRKLIEKKHDRVSAIVFITGAYKGKIDLPFLFDIWKKTSTRYFFYKISLFIAQKINNIHNKNNLISICNKKQIRVYNECTIDNKDIFDEIYSLNPKYLISVSCPQLVKKKWLELFNGKCINIHASKLPKYAGLAPYYWVLVNGEIEACITSHYMTSKFDQGNILSDCCLEIKKEHSVFSLFYDLSLKGSDVLIDAFEKMEQNHPGRTQNLSNYSYCSSPDKESYKKLRNTGRKLITISEFIKLVKDDRKNISAL